MTGTMTGGCQCGRIRYRVEVQGDDAYLCHCRMCQRATGGVASAMVNVPRAAVTWLDAPPDLYRSSPIADRGYCRDCGTPLTFAFLDPGSTNIDLTVGSFDDPGHFRPAGHFGVESRHDAWLDTTGLSEHRTDQMPAIVKRWEEAGGGVPD